MSDDVRFDIRAQDRTRDAFASVDRSLGGLTRGLGAMKVAFAATFVAAGAAALATMTKSAIDAASAIADMAANVGIGTTALQELRHAADMSGVSAETLDGALGQFTKRLGEARAGSGALATFLEKVDKNLLAAVKSSASTEQALDLVMAKMAGTANASDAAALATAAFGRSGVAMANLTRQGTAALEAMRHEAHQLGIVIDDAMIQKAEEAGDQLAKMEKSISANFTRALIAMSPAIVDLGNAFAAAAPKITAFILSFLPADMSGFDELQRRIAATSTQIDELRAKPLANPRGVMGRDNKLKELEAERQKLFELAEARVAAAVAGARSYAGDAGEAPDQPTAEKALDLIAKRTAALQLERDGVGLTAAAKERLTLVEAALNQARQDGLKVTPELRAEFEAMAESAGTLAGDLDFLKTVQSALTEAERETAQAAKEATDAHQRMVEEGKRIAEAVDPTLAYANTVERLNALLDAGAIDSVIFGKAVQQAADQMDKAGEKASKASDFARDMGMSFSSAFEDAIVGGKNFSEVLKGIFQDMLRIGVRKTLTEPLGNSFKDLFGSIGKLVPGFATGGEFAVGGGGGVDSQLVAFRATPGERVTISPPGQSSGGGASIVYNIDARGAEVGVEQRIRQVLAEQEPGMRARAVGESVRAVVDARRRDPGLFGKQ